MPATLAGFTNTFFGFQNYFWGLPALFDRHSGERQEIQESSEKEGHATKGLGRIQTQTAVAKFSHQGTKRLGNQTS